MRVDTERMEFNYIWLRDHCRCDACLRSSNMQRLINPIDIDPNIAPDQVSITDDKRELQITWPDGHSTSYQIDWLGKSYRRSTQRQEDKNRIFWDRHTLEASLPPAVEFEKYMESEEGVERLLQNLHKFGIAFMSGVPKTRAVTRAIGERINAPMKDTIYGEIEFFPELAKKLDDHGFSNGYLPFHTDFPSHYDPPGYLTLHYLKQSEVGGETIFSDALRAARILRESHPEHYEALATLPVAFHKIEKGIFVRSVTTVFDVRDPNQDPVIIRSSNDDRSVLTLPAPNAKRWYAAWRQFRQIVTDPNNIYTVKGMPGTMIFVDNWRLAHGRLAYEGTRELEMFFWSKDRIRSKLRTTVGNVDDFAGEY
ncbi:trimethyllysine dioxygenase, mitochondrial-like [Amphiura filiformis]|uniref:trimethyllysine dioxygenase, mitochondrial-like n=1 Tax=Amphiura filiformis TaxID=82378 RepID=UPI003B2139F8